MLQNLQNFAKIQKFQLDNLVDFERCCKTQIFLQKSVPIQPKTSTILPTFCQKLATTLRVRRTPHCSTPCVHGACVRGRGTDQLQAARLRRTGSKISKCCNFLAGSFLAVSKRNFARKYAFDSMFKAPQDLHTFAPLQSQYYSKKSV